MNFQPQRLRPPSRAIHIGSIIYLVIAFLATLELFPSLHMAMVVTLYVLLGLTLIRQLTLLCLAARERPPPRMLEGNEPPLVSVLLPAYNESAVIEASLQSLMELRYKN